MSDREQEYDRMAGGSSYLCTCDQFGTEQDVHRPGCQRQRLLDLEADMAERDYGIASPAPLGALCEFHGIEGGRCPVCSDAVSLTREEADWLYRVAAGSWMTNHLSRVRKLLAVDAERARAAALSADLAAVTQERGELWTALGNTHKALAAVTQELAEAREAHAKYAEGYREVEDRVETLESALRDAGDALRKAADRMRSAARAARS